ncbi:MAG: aldehyde dehydrogenase family protein [Alphaproteobacteria bacterium]|nr:aldehyde dehydrogenase family protein [Alphaproteobacteria bacterium]MCB9696794.1 aldehyde dehydrogenase family protein [Alphaproteobacteria bacterium]
MTRNPDLPKGEAPKRELHIADALPLSPAPETTPVRIRERYGHFVGGKMLAGRDDSLFPTTNPANGELLAQIAAADAAEVDKAVKSARAAYDKVWSKMSGAERGKYLFRIARRIQEKGRELAVLETKDNGKPIRETRDVDVPLAAAHFFYYAGWADKLQYAAPGRQVRPLGVAGQIIPWNFPLLMAAWKLAPALATGNTCVLKPAETTPLTAMALAEILQECELPPGVVNIVNGAGATGAALVAHAGIDKIAFTGSTGVGRLIMKQVAGSKKKSTMELGGKGANVVFADAALDQAVEGTINGIFFNQGHVCCAGSRLLLEESIAEEFMERLKRRVLALRIGDPLDKNTDVGAINSPEQLATVTRYIDIGRNEGATVWQGAATAPPAKGCFVLPTILSNVQQTDTVVREEIFGPVLSVLTFRTPAEAIAKANDTEYGLAAGVWTEKTSKLFEVAHALNAGVIWANGYNLFDPTSPFGGIRHSGFGREGGVAGLWPYLEIV